jgi:hypothetical protein
MIKPSKIISLVFIILFSFIISLSPAISLNGPCGEYHGHELYKGPKGGCYYINKNGNKTYVDRGYCNC